MYFIKCANAKGDNATFYFDFVREKGLRPSTGIFIYTKPKDQIQKNHNREALTLLEITAKIFNSIERSFSSYTGHLSAFFCVTVTGFGTLAAMLHMLMFCTLITTCLADLRTHLANTF